MLAPSGTCALVTGGASGIGAGVVFEYENRPVSSTKDR